MTEYVELHSRSAFSFLEGASLPEALIARAAELEMSAMALLDRNGIYGAPRFHTEGQRRGVRAHIGAEVAVSDLGERLRPPAYLPHQHPAEPVRLPLLKYREIAEQLGIGMNSVNTLLARALRKLQQAMGQKQRKGT